MRKSLFLTAIIFLIISIAEAKENYLSRFKKYHKPNIRVFILSNQDYHGTNMDLSYTMNDGRLYRTIFSKVLNVPEEKIEWHANLTRDAFYSQFNHFVKSIKKGELIYFVYSGHGREDGTPVFTDLRSISPVQYRQMFNHFNNDTVFIMDSCYSGAMRGSLSPRVMSKGFRGNILRLYSSLANQTSKESNYFEHITYKKSFEKTQTFLEKLGYRDRGNGWFSLLFASW